MKQTGKTWTTHDGSETLAKFVPAYDRLTEKNGQKIAAKAIAIEDALMKAAAEMKKLCEEAYRNQPGDNPKQKKFFSFTTFDKEFKIEYLLEDNQVKVYRATKKNPSSKDYTQICMDMSKMTGKGIIPHIIEGENEIELVEAEYLLPMMTKEETHNAQSLPEVNDQSSDDMVNHGAY